MSVTDDKLGCASEKQMLETGSSVGCDHDQVGVLMLSATANLLAGMPDLHR